METAKTAAEIYRHFGAFDFLILCMCLALGFLVYKIAKTNESAAEKLNELGNVFATHHQNALDMHGTCRRHGDQISDLHKGMVEFKGEVTSELSDLSKEVAILKESVS